MAKYAGVQFTTLLVDGYNIIAAIADTASESQESITQQTNAFGAESEEHTPLHVERGTFVVGGGFYDEGTNELLNKWDAIRALNRIVCCGIEGNIIGKHFIGLEGAYDQKYEIVDNKDQLTRANLTFSINGDINQGIIVQHLATFTEDWDTKTGGAGAPDAPVDFIDDVVQTPKGIASNAVGNPSIVTMKSEHGVPIKHNLTTGQKILISGVTGSDPTINGEQTITVVSDTTFSVPVNVTTPGSGGSFILSSTVNGGVGYLQVTVYNGFTGFVNKIMHSPDDATYATLITFDDLGTTYTPAKQRKTVTGTVDRYLSNQGDVTGTGSVTVFCGFCRN